MSHFGGKGTAAIKGLKIGKAAGPTGVVREMMKAADGFGSRWMTDLINIYSCGLEKEYPGTCVQGER